MGFKTEFNWVLKLTPEQGFPEQLEVRKQYKFEKKEYRVYPVDMHINLVDKDWVERAIVVIKECTLKDGLTTGFFEVTKLL